MKWMTSLSGYVEAALWGSNPERVINMALSRGIRIWDIVPKGENRYELKVSLGGYKAFRHLTRRSSCKTKILSKKGAPFLLMRAKRRKVLVLGTLFFCVALYILSSFVWFIEVKGNHQTTPAEILNIARKYGLEVGIPKACVDKKEVKNKLLLEFPRLSWVGINVKGTKIIIEVAEKTPIPNDSQNKPADIAAGIDGKVEELLTLTGTPVVKEGDIVKKGQILILGEFYPHIKILEDGTMEPDGEPEMIRARGVVRAQVERSVIEKCYLREEKAQDTGNEAGVVFIKVNGREIYIKGNKKIPFKHYRTIREVRRVFELKGRKLHVPVEVISVIYKEQVRKINKWGLEGAYKEAVRRAKEKVKAELPADCKVIAQSYEPVPIQDKGMVAVKYILETVENIGVYKEKASR